MMNKKTFYLDKKSNEAAYLMAMKLCERGEKQQSLSPVVFYGKSGNGKTHLVKIMKEKLLKQQKKVLLINSDDFVSRLIYRMRSSSCSIIHFCEEFEQYDVLILEDIQYLQNKSATQECLVDISERFLQKGKQIIFTMNCKPKKLKEFDEKLRAKFSHAVLIPILEPSDKLKRKIIKNWCGEHQQKLNQKSIRKIAKKAKSVGELLGILKHFQFYIELYEVPSNKKLVKKILKERGI